jgi:hypothetical protein
MTENKIKFEEPEKDFKEDYVLVNGKKRKLNKVVGNVFYVVYKKQKIHLVRIWGWGAYSYKFFNYDAESYSNTIFCWEDAKAELKKMVKKYKKYEVEDSSVPSAPNSSMFKATIGGELKVETDYMDWGGRYGLDRHYLLLVTIGSGIKNLPQSFYDELYSILTRTLLIYKNSVTIDSFYGTAFSGIGLRKI